MSERKTKGWNTWVFDRLVGFAWAPDLKWDWTADNGDSHTDYVSLARCTRGDLSFMRLTVGPLMLTASIGLRPKMTPKSDERSGR